MAESFSDPQWAEFEQINAKTLVRPRDDFVFRFGQDFEAGLRSEVGEIVYNPADGLVYRCIKETDSVAPDYTNATSNLYWLWIAGSISGYVAGRGWWTKFADGTLIQRSIPIPNPAFAVSTFLHKMAHVTMSWTLPIPFNDTDYDAVGSFAYSTSNGLSGYWGVHEDSKTTAIVVGRAISPHDYPANTMYLRIVAIGRWKA